MAQKCDRSWSVVSHMPGTLNCGSWRERREDACCHWRRSVWAWPLQQWHASGQLSPLTGFDEKEKGRAKIIRLQESVQDLCVCILEPFWQNSRPLSMGISLCVTEATVQMSGPPQHLLPLWGPISPPPSPHCISSHSICQPYKGAQTHNVGAFQHCLARRWCLDPDKHRGRELPILQGLSQHCLHLGWGWAQDYGSLGHSDIIHGA